MSTQQIIDGWDRGVEPYEKKHYCDQCHKDMGYEWILGPVCGKCCRKNHAKATGRKVPTA